MQRDEHLLNVLRYVEQNALGAELIARAEDWRWRSLWARGRGDKAIKAILSPWPVERPRNWTERVNAPLSAGELEQLGVSIERNRPYGDDKWIKRTAGKLGLEHTMRPLGRPPQADPGEVPLEILATSSLPGPSPVPERSRPDSGPRSERREKS